MISAELPNDRCAMIFLTAFVSLEDFGPTFGPILPDTISDYMQMHQGYESPKSAQTQPARL